MGSLHVFAVLCSLCTPSVYSRTVDGHWGSWTEYSTCSRSCGTGYQVRYRYCNNPPPTHHGHSCSGAHQEERPCHLRACPVNGQWGSWTGYQACSVTCGTGTQTRYRYCNSPHPQNGGRQCVGDDTQKRACTQTACQFGGSQVNGAWGSWSQFSTCTHTCGGGTQTSYRWCDSPRPSGGGAQCQGNDLKHQQCNTNPCVCTGSKCPVNGNWGQWTDYQACSTTCGSGTQTRYRYCNSPHPAHGGRPCTGDSYNTRTCYVPGCGAPTAVVDGGWSLWSDYNTCSKSCGSGYQTRFRQCTNPAPSSTGQPCHGDSMQTQVCHSEACPCAGTNCPVDGGWTSWSNFGHCSVTCGSGTHTRTRTCTNPTPAHGGSTCTGASKQTQSCSLTACPTISDSCGTTLVDGTHTKIVVGTVAQHGDFPRQIGVAVLVTGPPNERLELVCTTSSTCTGSQVVHVSHLYTHEHYDGDAMRNDIAQIKLSKPLDITGSALKAAPSSLNKELRYRS